MNSLNIYKNWLCIHNNKFNYQSIRKQIFNQRNFVYQCNSFFFARTFGGFVFSKWKYGMLQYVIYKVLNNITRNVNLVTLTNYIERIVNFIINILAVYLLIVTSGYQCLENRFHIHNSQTCV